uniref:Cadherin 9 n=1 Tax=Loxodonta africana TaxID=9785 RepID=G3TYW4_LOXAF
MRTYHCLPLLIWTYMFHIVDAIPFQEKTNNYLPSKRTLDLTKDNGKMLRRSKRGWMWNQFFLLEEYTGTDTQYVGKRNLHTTKLRGNGNRKPVTP